MKTNKRNNFVAAEQACPQLRTLSLVVGAALAVMAAEAALADSAVGQETSLGNALNLAPINPVTYGSAYDIDGINGSGVPSRTPTGQLYLAPRVPTDRINTTAGGWEYFGFVEFGLIRTTGDRKEHGFKRYKDVDSGGYLNAFGVSANKKDSAHYFEIVGGGVDHDDQFYGATFGRYNDWRLKAFYNETPHVFTTSFRNLWNNPGSSNLTLKPGLTPGGTGDLAADNAAITAVAQANANTELGLVRKKGGLRYDVNLTDKLKLFASYSLEKREGSRPFGSVWAGGGGQGSLETIEPINYETHDIVGGMYYNDRLNSFNLQASASLFRNKIDTFTFETPLRVGAAAGIEGATPGMFSSGRFDLYPDNEAYNVKGEYARRLPELMNGRFSAVVSMGSSRQDDKLIPWTHYEGLSMANVATSNWNTMESLSQRTADSRIDTRLIDLGLSLNPTNRLNVKAKARYYETKNRSGFLACNPNAEYIDRGDGESGGLTGFGCTGVWGRLLNNGSGLSMLNGANAAGAGNLPIRSIPFDYKKLNTGVTADWRLDKASINAAYDRETYRRDHRERDKTWEDKFKLGYINRSMDDITVRLSLAHDRRRGSTYETHHPYASFISGALVPMPDTGNVQSWAVHMNGGLRKFDLADRNQNTLNARLNYMPREDLDIGLSAQLKEIRYPGSDYGRGAGGKQRQNWFNFDIDWQYSPVSSMYAYYSHQRGNMWQRSVASGGGTGCLIGADSRLGVITQDNAEYICQSPLSGAVWLGENFWELNHKDYGNTVGVGLRHDFGVVKFDMSYTYARNRTEMRYDVPANLNEAQRAAAGGGFPDLVNTQNVLEANLLMPINKTVSARLLLRHEYGKYRDWHYYGFEENPVAVNAPGTTLPAAVVLDAGPQTYRANLIGLMLQFRL